MTAVQEIDRFVKELGAWHLLQVLRQVVVRGGLVFAVSLVILHWWYGAEILPWTLGSTLVGLALAAVWAAWRRSLRVREVDRRLELKDRLTTWQHLRRRGVGIETPMAGWLAEDLAEHIEAIPEPRRRAAVALRIGWLRYLLPILILLFLLELIAPFGGAGGGAGGFGGGGPGGTGGGPGGGSGTGESEFQTAEPEPAPPTDGPMESPPPPVAPTPPLGGPPPPPEGANPLPELEVRDEFVVPHFVGEGETRRQLARQARVADQRPTAAPPAGSAGSAGQPPATQEMSFEQAYERALQSRHVPEEERGFLRRYFRILRERSR